MSFTNTRKRLALGDAILDRLAGETLPALAKPTFAEFQKTHRAYVAASAVVDAAKQRESDALDAVGAADSGLDVTIDQLANALVGASLGTRAKPFGSFSKRSVSDLQSLAYAREADEAIALGAAITKKGAPKSVLALASKAGKQAGAVKTTLKGLTKPQAAVAQARLKRDALLPDWTRALNRFRKLANAAWVDAPETFAAVFAEPDAVTAPVTKRKKKKATPEDAKKK